MTQKSLIFFEDKHEYRVDGVVVPSVSEVIRFISREVYSDTPAWRMKSAAERGTLVHKCCEELDRVGTCEVSNEVAGYVSAYASFLNAHRVEWRGIEASLYHPQMMYAGTLDRFGIVDDIPTIVDLKTNAQPNFPLIEAQLGGYGLLASCVGFTAQKHLCLQLKKDGTYRLIWHGTDPHLFKTCYDLHEATKKKGKRNGRK